jgi:hypothetical protein
MFRTKPTVAALVLIVAAGVVQTLLATATTDNEAIRSLAKRIDDIPLVIGDWQAEQGEEPDELTMRVADAAGMIQRLYLNTRDNTQVQIMLLVGRPGPLSVHLPEVCYRGAGYREQRAIAERAIEVGSDTPRFRVVDMENNSGSIPRYMRVYHTWTDGTGWTVPKVPRLAFARSPYLCKLYVTTVPLTAPIQGDVDPASRFIETCLPAIEKVLVPN